MKYEVSRRLPAEFHPINQGRNSEVPRFLFGLAPTRSLCSQNLRTEIDRNSYQSWISRAISPQLPTLLKTDFATLLLQCCPTRPASRLSPLASRLSPKAQSPKPSNRGMDWYAQMWFLSSKFSPSRGGSQGLSVGWPSVVVRGFRMAHAKNQRRKENREPVCVMLGAEHLLSQLPFKSQRGG